jgi:hypothetical protein
MNDRLVRLARRQAGPIQGPATRYCGCTLTKGMPARTTGNATRQIGEESSAQARMRTEPL